MHCRALFLLFLSSSSLLAQTVPGLETPAVEDPFVAPAVESLPEDIQTMDAAALRTLLLQRQQAAEHHAAEARTAATERDRLRAENTQLKEKQEASSTTGTPVPTAEEGINFRNPAAIPAPQAPAPQQASARKDSHVEELGLAIGFLGFGLFAMLFQFIILKKTGGGWTQSNARLFGLILIITSGGFITSAGYTQAQITPMIGLLGTVAGFLLGQQSPPKPAETTSDTPAA